MARPERQMQIGDAVTVTLDSLADCAREILIVGHAVHHSEEGTPAGRQTSTTFRSAVSFSAPEMNRLGAESVRPASDASFDRPTMKGQSTR
jgi:hypothetical protein